MTFQKKDFHLCKEGFIHDIHINENYISYVIFILTSEYSNESGVRGFQTQSEPCISAAQYFLRTKTPFSF